MKCTQIADDPVIDSHLVSIAVSLPVCDTVLLGDILALGEQLLVRDLLLVLDALLLNELLWGEHSLTELLLLQTLLALLVWHNLKHVHVRLLYTIHQFVFVRKV